MSALIVAPLLAQAPDEGYNQEDRRKLMDALEESHRTFSVVLERCSRDQSLFKPESLRWNILEIAEHLTLTEDFLFGFVKKSLEGKPSNDPPAQDPEVFDRLIMKSISDRSQKATSPREATPNGKYSDLDQARQAFGERRAKTIEWVRQNKLPLRKYRSKSPVGEMDAHQWILMIAAHTNRHIQQIEELQKHELFPKTD